MIQASEKTGGVMLSVVVLAYDHEKTIEKALGSILGQKTNYPFEILVGEDASTDGTAAIVSRMAQEHPGRITAVIRPENIGATANIYDLLSRARGRFIAFLEGDDYWSDCHKLQMQTDFLLSREEYIACCHRCLAVDANDDPLDDQTIDWIADKEVYTAADFKGIYMPGHLSTIVCRNIFADPRYDYSIIRTADPLISDRTIAMLLCAQGDIYSLPIVMSRYRRILDESGKNATVVKYNSNANQVLDDYFFTRRLEDYAEKNFPGKFDFSPHLKEQFVGAVVRFVSCPSPDTLDPVKAILSDSGKPFSYIWHFIKILPGRALKKLRRRFGKAA